MSSGLDFSAADAGDDPLRYDDALQSAVRRFQARHGLEVDGVVGRATLAALNVPVAARIDQVLANLERLRWVARELAGDYLLVDIAGFRAELWLDGAPAWSARAVVGKPYRTTPEFRARMKYLVLNPEWSVPPTILREDVLPRVLQDPGHLARHDMRLLDRAGGAVDPRAVEWERWRAQPRAFPYLVVQAPGGDNPLGGVKFMFPNDHSVYLHDTPSRALFGKPVRAASSGCIRIENPRALARLLLDDPQRWPETAIDEAIAGGRTRIVPVKRAVPVLLLYFTAVADETGAPQFRPDLYARDAPIVRALAAPFRFTPVDARAKGLGESRGAGVQRAGRRRLRTSGGHRAGRLVTRSTAPSSAGSRPRDWGGRAHGSGSATPRGPTAGSRGRRMPLRPANWADCRA